MRTIQHHCSTLGADLVVDEDVDWGTQLSESSRMHRSRSFGLKVPFSTRYLQPSMLRSLGRNVHSRLIHHLFEWRYRVLLLSLMSSNA